MEQPSADGVRLCHRREEDFLPLSQRIVWMFSKLVSRLPQQSRKKQVQVGG